MERDITFKICIFGGFGVGKTTLARRYLTNLFDSSIKLTLGMEIHVKYLKVENYTVSLQIWDFGGQERFRYLLPGYSRGSFGGIFMYDISNKSSIQKIEDWIPLFREQLKNDKFEIPMILVGGKLDLAETREVSKEEGLKFKENLKFLDFIECSAKTGVNVEPVFEILVRKILEIRGFISV